MNQKNNKRTIAIVGILSFMYLIIESWRINVYSWIPDSVFSILIILFCFWKYDKLKLNKTIFILIILSFFLHNAGVFGFYGESPFPIAWDHITHFVGIFTAAIFFFNFLKDHFKESKKMHNGMLLFIILLAALGIGSLVENIEFAGYLFLGEGEGALYFGQGDAVPGVDTDMLNFAGGGWFNTMWDLVVNFLGALTGILSMLLYKKITFRS